MKSEECRSVLSDKCDIPKSPKYESRDLIAILGTRFTYTKERSVKGLASRVLATIVLVNKNVW